MNLDEKYVYYITTINSAIEKFIMSNNKHPMEIIIPNRIFDFLKLVYPKIRMQAHPSPSEMPIWRAVCSRGGILCRQNLTT